MSPYVGGTWVRTTDPRPDGLVSTRDAARISGATLRQVDYWKRVGCITPAFSPQGSGTRVGWGPDDVRVLRVFRGMSDLWPSGPSHGFSNDLMRAVDAAVRVAAPGDLLAVLPDLTVVLVDDLEDVPVVALMVDPWPSDIVSTPVQDGTDRDPGGHR